MGDTEHLVCDRCGRSDATVDQLPAVAVPYYLCEPCHEDHEMDLLIPARAMVADNSPTRPNRAPGEDEHC